MIGDKAQRGGRVAARLRVEDAKVGLDPMAQVLWVVVFVAGDRHRLERCDMIRERPKKTQRVFVT